MTAAEDTFSRVLETMPALPEEAHQHFSRKLSCETDPADVYTDIQNSQNNFIFVDVRSPDDYKQAHAEGAVNIPHVEMTEERMAEFSKDQVFVVYCWGPGCNGATKAGFKLSRLGFPVKEMIGGIEYWEKEGYPVIKG